MPFSFDPLSFAIGFVAASIFWFLASRIRPAFHEWRQAMAARREEAQARRSASIEENHRRITLRRAQGMHLAAPLFSLDEILIPPLLMAPPPRVEPGRAPLHEDIVTQTLPYLPAWPELAALYGAPTLTLPQALSGGCNLVILGMDGLGKTVALAHLASLCANRDPQVGELSEKVPFLVHTADLNLPVSDPKNILNPIIDTAAQHVSFLDYGRMAAFVEQSFQSGRALLLLDGFDELAPDGQQVAVEFLQTLLKSYPLIRVVATALPEQMDGLFGLGFAPLALMGWNANRQAEFIRKWGEQWMRFVATEAWAQAIHEPIDPLLLEAWLEFGNQYLTPLELTLKVWSGFAGDSLGPRVRDALAAHIRRLTPADTPPGALETLAMQVVINAQPIFDARRAREWVKSFEPVEAAPAETPPDAESEAEPAAPSARKKEAETIQAPSSGLLGKMSASGLLLPHSGNRMRFIHPALGGYLAGRALSAYRAEDRLLNQPDWGGKLLAMRHLAAHGDASRLADALMAIEDPLLQRPLLNAARWLREAPREAAWRGKIMSALARLLQDENHPRGLRGQAMAAFALSGDPGAMTLFRQALQSLSFELIALAALGCGVLRDAKAVELLASTLSAPSLAARSAACLALVAIGTPAALEAVARALLNGDDELRRAAAEALANDPKEGHATLKDGATLPDILVRRAAVYGLARVDEPWALDMLRQIQVEDDQWIVRTAATDALESKSPSADPRIPRPLTPPAQTPWLIEFAGKQGMGVSPGAPATDLLIKALKDGNEEERLAALSHLRRTPSEGVVKSIYEAVRSSDSELREAAYQTLWEMGSGGIALPHPSQFGLG